MSVNISSFSLSMYLICFKYAESCWCLHGGGGLQQFYILKNHSSKIICPNTPKFCTEQGQIAYYICTRFGADLRPIFKVIHFCLGSPSF